jgi:osmoprotectant transport system permease protein
VFNRSRWLFRLACFALLALSLPAVSQPLVVGSKRFTESYILGEIVSQAVAGSGQDRVRLKSGLGNTGILLSALLSGEIDLYPEYTGTITREILKTEQALSLEQINERLAPLGLRAGVLLGFDNSYVLAMRREQAHELQIKAISDLAKHPRLVPGLSHEFIGRKDGWKGLSEAYQLGGMSPRGLDHGLAYEAIVAKQIDVVDAYGTDSKLKRYGLTVLQDDRRFFPTYEALLLYRADVPTKFPEAWKIIQALQNKISQETMLGLNTRVEIDGQTFAAVAQQFLLQKKTDQTQGATSGVNSSDGQRVSTLQSFSRILFAPDFWRLGAQHVFLVLFSLLLALVVGLPLGIVCFYWPRTGQAVLFVIGIIQTIPSLALLAFLISLFGLIGTTPAIVALFLYALLPIVQSTHAGFSEISSSMRQAATALGLGFRLRLFLIEVPLARTMILSGIKVAAVTSVGTATIAAFVGAGGFGERIAQGLALNNTSMLLAGAIPSAALALLIQGGFYIYERRLANRRR